MSKPEVTLVWVGGARDGKRAYVEALQNDGWNDLRIEVDTDDCDSKHAKAAMQAVIDRVNDYPKLERELAAEHELSSNASDSLRNWIDKAANDAALIGKLEQEVARLRLIEAEELEDRTAMQHVLNDLDIVTPTTSEGIELMGKELAELREDKARLDWLDKSPDVEIVIDGHMVGSCDLRQFIDDTRKS